MAYDKELAGIRDLLAWLQRADNIQLAQNLEAALSTLVSMDGTLSAYKTEKDRAVKALEAAQADASSQSQRADEARKAADDVVAAVSGLAATAKSDHAAYLKQISDAQVEKQKEWDAYMKKYETDRQKLEAEKAAANAAAQRVYLEKAAAYETELDVKRAALAQVQAAYDALKAKLLS